MLFGYTFFSIYLFLTRVLYCCLGSENLPIWIIGTLRCDAFFFGGGDLNAPNMTKPTFEVL